ncbi:hypothetical protein EYF80_030765 [Liparis tanakae]|uniref:Uncharacterized protein n=1 Tax=Liparis tanakae TaxID=230148 RepID=A0A4Z2GZH2_9TELE|nr:hypothetical protein EYF80_030765 [Liparis tanakae]
MGVFLTSWKGFTFVGFTVRTTSVHMIPMCVASTGGEPAGVRPRPLRLTRSSGLRQGEAQWNHSSCRRLQRR